MAVQELLTIALIFTPTLTERTNPEATSPESGSNDVQNS